MAAQRWASRHVNLAAILQSPENLLSFPWIAERVSTGGLTAHGWHFDLDHY